jgi:hypothetical protein
MALKFEILDHGCEHAQYWQGQGVAYTQYTDIATGSGSSAREAGEDALEIFWQSADKRQITVAEAERLENAIKLLSEEEDAHENCVHNPDSEEPEDVGCEMAHRVSIRWRYAP